MITTPEEFQKRRDELEAERLQREEEWVVECKEKICAAIEHQLSFGCLVVDVSCQPGRVRNEAVRRVKEMYQRAGWHILFETYASRDKVSYMKVTLSVP